MLIKGENVHSTSRLLKLAREKKMTIITRTKLMYLTFQSNYKKHKVKWLGQPLRWIEWDIAVYRVDTMSEKEINRINYYLKKNPDKNIFYNSLDKGKEIIET